MVMLDRVALRTISEVVLIDIAMIKIPAGFLFGLEASFKYGF